MKAQILALSLLLLVGCSSVSPATTPFLDTSEELAWEKIDKGALVIDLRSEQAYAHSHIKGAIHIPLHTLPLKLDELQYPKDEPVVLYSQEEDQASHAQGVLLEHGFSDVVSGGTYFKLMMAGDMRD